jgi:hypothetical protein
MSRVPEEIFAGGLDDDPSPVRLISYPEVVDQVGPLIADQALGFGRHHSCDHSGHPYWVSSEFEDIVGLIRDGWEVSS